MGINALNAFAELAREIEAERESVRGSRSAKKKGKKLTWQAGLKGSAWKIELIIEPKPRKPEKVAFPLCCMPVKRGLKKLRYESERETMLLNQHLAYKLCESGVRLLTPWSEFPRYRAFEEPGRGTEYYNGYTRPWMPSPITQFGNVQVRQLGRKERRELNRWEAKRKRIARRKPDVLETFERPNREYMGKCKICGGESQYTRWAEYRTFVGWTDSVFAETGRLIRKAHREYAIFRKHEYWCNQCWVGKRKVAEGNRSYQFKPRSRTWANHILWLRNLSKTPDRTLAIIGQPDA